MDSYAYNPTGQLHELFNSPDTLSELPQLLLHTNQYKKQLDKKIQKDIARYNDTYSTTLDKDTLSLIGQVKQLKDNSTQIQGSITSMTSSIQKLDQYKKNLVLSMTVLQRLQMLVNAYNSLTETVPTHNYKEIIQLLSMVKELLNFFKPYKSIDEINQIHLMINATQAKLVDDIFLDFEDCISTKSSNTELIYGCQILELIDLKYKDKLLNWFYNAQLKDITSIFNNFEEAGSLDNLGRRYLYFQNNTLKSIRSKYVQIFPPEWKVDLELTKLFCKITNQDLINLLNNAAKRPTMDSKTLLDNLFTTLEFEKALNDTFKTNDFHSIISIVFEPYLKLWINEQDKVLNTKGNEFLSTPQLPQEFQESGSPDDFFTILKVNNVPNIANSSTELFKNFQKTLTQILKLSNGEILVDLARLFIKYLFDFHNRVLMPIVPKNDQDLGTGLEPIKYLTMLLNTGDYIINNINELSDKLENLIKPAYKSKIPSFEYVKDAYYKIINSSISNLLVKISNDLKLSWRQFINYNWQNTVGDGAADEVSNYMVDIHKVLLTNNLRFILPLIIRDSYIRNFNDKLVEMLVTTLAANLRFVKPLSVLSLEQILRDINYLRKLALKFPLYTDTNYDESSTSTETVSKLYQKHVNFQFDNLESLLKVLMSPVLPLESLIERYFEVIGDNSVTNFVKVLQLKNIDKPDQKKYIDNFRLQLTLESSPVPPSPLLSSLDEEEAVLPNSNNSSTPITPEIKSPKLLPVKMNFENHLRELAMNSENQVNKLNENFKNFGKFFRKDND